MTDKITLELTLDELKTIDKHIEYNEETQSVFDKIKYAYPQPKMTLENEGEYVVVSYNDMTYYRLEGELSYFFCWYERRGVSANHPIPTLVMVDDAETERLLEGLYYNYIVVKKETAQQRGERVHNEMEEVVRESVKWCEENPDKDPLDYLTPKTPEEIEESLKEAFREGLKQVEKIKEVQRKIDDGYFNDFIFIDRPNLLDFLKDKLGYSTDCCYEIVDAISEWLPETQNASGSQNAYVESAVEGWNDAINAIRGKLQ
jgi:hypothetical protein